MQKSEDADLLVPILIALAFVVGIGVHHTYFKTPETAEHYATYDVQQPEPPETE